METIKEQIEQLKAAAGELSPDRLGRLDFDRLRALLAKQEELLVRLGEDRTEKTLLRNDLIARVAGMAKAIAAVSRRTERIREAADYVERLADKSAADLLDEYRLVSARFRDTFPTSFGRLFETRKRRRNESFDRP